jgi:hypothetical protein
VYQKQTPWDCNPRAFFIVASLYCFLPTTAPTAAAATATGTIRFGAGFVDRDRSAIDLAAVNTIDGGPRFLFVVHRHEREAPWPTRFAIHHDSHFIHTPVIAERGLEAFLRG